MSKCCWFALTSLLFLGRGTDAVGGEPFQFRDLAPAKGITAIDAQISVHSLAWGDADGDGWIDLYIGAMVKDEKQKASALFWNDRGRFRLDTRNQIGQPRYRATGSVFVDLDNDGLLELYISSHAKDTGNPESVNGHPNLLYWAKPGRVYERIMNSGATPPGLTGRSIGVLDYNGDGLLDLFIPTAPKKGQRARLFRNAGALKFEDAGREAQLPDEIFGLGVAVADLTGNGWPDFFVGGSNRLFLNRGDGTFREAVELRPLLDWNFHRSDMTASCGVAFGDLNRDGKPDLAIGQHPKWPWSKDPLPVRIFLNRGISLEKAKLEEITQQAGLQKIWMKAPHVEIRDFDNDGLPDVLTSVAVYRDGKVYPLIYRNKGCSPGGIPELVQTALGHQADFPTDEDKAIPKNTFYEAVAGNLRVWYSPQSPSGDFDNDGRLDLYQSRDWPKTPGRLLRNETPSGHWLDVQVIASTDLKINRQGIGSIVEVYRPGRSGELEALLYREEIATGYGFCSGQPARAHIGLGPVNEVDLKIILPHGRGRVTMKQVKADRPLKINVNASTISNK